MHPVDLLPTKLTPPAQRGGEVERARLLSKLAADPGPRLTLVIAPAGYGKTVLMTQWRTALKAAGRRAAWVSLDETDNDPFTFFTYVREALRTQGLGSPSGAPGHPKWKKTSFGTVLMELVHQLADRHEPLYLFLDDFHYIDDRKLIEGLARILSAASPDFHLVLSSRTRPPLPLGRLRAANQLLELDERDLRFTESETVTYFSLPDRPLLSPSDARSLTEITEGWIAAIQLAYLSMKRRGNPADVLADLTEHPRDVSAYLVEEVLDGLDDEARDFLLGTSLLRRFCADLCDHTLGITRSRRIIARLEEAHLFLFSLDASHTWYRYHHLFAKFLLKRLSDQRSEEDVRRLHKAASEWFLEHDYCIEAVEHAIESGSTDFLGDVLEKSCERLFHTGRHSFFKQAVARLPYKAIVNRPLLCLYCIWEDEISWKFDEAQRMLAELKKRLAIPEARKPAIPSETAHPFQRDLLQREMMLALMSDDLGRAEQLCRVWLKAFRVAGDYDTNVVEMSLFHCRREMLDCRSAAVDAIRFHDVCKEAGIIHGVIWAAAITVPGLFLIGRLDEAEFHLSCAIDVAVELDGRDSALAAMPGLLMAQVKYERNQLAEAKALLERYGKLSSEIGFVDQLIAGFLTQSRLLDREGRRVEADRVLAEALAFADTRGFSRLRFHLAAEGMRRALAEGQAQKARDIAREHDILVRPASCLPKPGATAADAERAMVSARLACASDDARQTLPLLRAWTGFAERRGCYALAVRFLLLHTRAAYLVGEKSEALRHLLRAVDLGREMGFCRSFVDEYEPISLLLGEIAETASFRGTPQAEYALRLLEAAETTNGQPSVPAAEPAEVLSDEPPAEPLTPREVQILELVEEGLKGNYIASRLAISEGTVRWHLQQIFAKLGVRRRSEAVRRAREFGFMPPSSPGAGRVHLRPGG